MNLFDLAQAALAIGTLALCAPLLGRFFARVYRDEPHLLRRPLAWLERLARATIGTSYEVEMDWRVYAKTLLVFNLLGGVVVLGLQWLQGYLPLNPQNLPAVSWHLAFNTAVSFLTNTNWQSYAGETTLSYLVQMVALTVQNFVSAATGMAVAVALARGVVARQSRSLGNFWQDLVRGTVYILLPASIVLAVVLVSQGVVQSLRPAVELTTLEGASQTLPLGPAASQIAIKQLGTNGGGFFNANGAHPFENSTPLSNFLQLISILLIPAGFAFLWGELVRDQRQGRILFGVMLALLLISLAVAGWSEYAGVQASGLASAMEGKETRFGIMNSLLWSVFTTAASNGSVNAMLSSLSPLAGGAALFNILLGEVVFGGVGAGLYGIVLFVILTVFLAGLMVGRTPEYLGKKIQAHEVQMVLVGIVLPSATILLGTGVAAVLPVALSSIANPGPHGLTELLYAFASAAGNNGSAFAGLNANTPFFNVALGVAMLVGRFGVILPVLAIAGSLAEKSYSPPGIGTFTTDNALFGVLLVAVIVIVGGLTFFPALCLGPIVEHLLLNAGRTF